MQTALVTGATSFIGANLVENLAEKEYEVIAVARPGSRNIDRIPQRDNITVLELDMSRVMDLPRYIHHVDIFFSLAWEGARGASRLDEQLQQENCRSTLSAVKTSCILGAKVFVGCGSQAEYGTPIGITTEQTKANPDTPYGKAKLICCQEGENIARSQGLRFVWPRIFSVYGPGDFPGTLIASSMEKMLLNEPIECSACTQKWDYLYVKDAADALSLLAQKGDGVYNVASGDVRPLRMYLEEMRRLLGSDSELHFGPNAGPSIHPSVEKIFSLGWKPKFSFAQGIEQYAAWLQREAGKILAF